MKKNLDNVTFIIPIRIDSQDRIDNINLTADYILSNYDTTVMIYEYDTEKKYDAINDNIKYKFVYDDKKFFHRTKVLNDMIDDSTTDVVVNYDADVLLPSTAYENSYMMIQSGADEFVYPYDGRFMSLDREYHWQIKEKGYKIENMNIDYITKVVHPNSVGGAFMALKDAYIRCGKENENFRAWGYEDNERYNRISKLIGRDIARVNTPLIHLEHWRGPDSSFNNPYIDESREESRRIASMDKNSLENYISTWRWR